MYRILLVDDEILVRDAIRENIDWKAMDCELVGDCDNGKAAAEFVQNHPVDIVLTDILMPYMDGMELSRFLHDNYPDIVIVIFSGFGEFEYAKKAIQYGVSEYMLKPVTAMELRNVIGKMKEKVDQQRKEKEKLERLTQTSENYQKNAIVIRSRALQGFVDNIKTRQESLEELAALGIDLEAACYRVAVFDLDLYSDGSQLTAEKRQESALMSFVLFNISDEIISKEKAGVAYQAGNNKVGALFMGNRTREFEHKIMEICRTIQDKLKELMSLDISIGVGSWARTQQELRASHELAEKAIEYRYLLGGSLLIDMEEQPEEKNLSIKAYVEKLAVALKVGKRKTQSIFWNRSLLRSRKRGWIRVVPACIFSRSSVQQMRPVRIWFRTTGFFPKEKHFCSRLRSRILLTVLLNWSGIISERFSRHFPMQTAPADSARQDLPWTIFRRIIWTRI